MQPRKIFPQIIMAPTFSSGILPNIINDSSLRKGLSMRSQNIARRQHFAQ